ncbi:hypothetical protein V6000_006715 [Aspergillus fumigatus]
MAKPHAQKRSDIYLATSPFIITLLGYPMCPSFLDTSFSLCFFISWVSFDPFNLNLDVLHSSALMSHVSITRLCLLISSPSLISWWHTVFPRSFLLFEHLFPVISSVAFA